MSETFNAQKAVQISATLIELNGGSVDRYALIKMVYEIDRDACAKWGHSLTGDAPLSMEHGPVLSHMCDITKGTTSPKDALWNEYIGAADEEHVISLKKPLADKDHLSKAEMEIIHSVYGKRGKMSFSQLKKWSHSLSEYEHVSKGEVRDISVEKRLGALGKNADQIKDIIEEDAEDSRLRVAFGL